MPLTIDDPAAVVMGKEPVVRRRPPVGYVTSAAYGYTIGTPHRLRLAAGRGRPRRASRCTIGYFGEAVPAAVAAEPLFDPEMTRLRG